MTANCFTLAKVVDATCRSTSASITSTGTATRHSKQTHLNLHYVPDFAAPPQGRSEPISPHAATPRFEVRIAHPEFCSGFSDRRSVCTKNIRRRIALARIVKAPEERRAEIVETAERLFRERGYAKCSVEMIIREVGVAKGTFYYYFKSKPDILQAIVDKLLSRIIDTAMGVAGDASLTAMQKMKALLGNSHIGDEDGLEVAEMLHLPENRELHELTNIQTVLRLSPILAQIVEQGNEEGVFDVDMPLETIQFLFTGSQFLTDGGLFGFCETELRARRLVMQTIIEKALGAEPASFNFMNPTKVAK